MRALNMGIFDALAVINEIKRSRSLAKSADWLSDYVSRELNYWIDLLCLINLSCYLFVVYAGGPWEMRKQSAS